MAVLFIASFSIHVMNTNNLSVALVPSSRKNKKLWLEITMSAGSEARPASYPGGTGSFSLVVERPEREADHSPPSSAEINNAWRYTSSPPICLHGVVLN
jgi:hypothetical protein